jgi:hypothetical protein
MIFDALPGLCYWDYEEYAKLAAACDVDVSAKMHSYLEQNFISLQSEVFDQYYLHTERIKSYVWLVNGLNCKLEEKFYLFLDRCADHLLSILKSEDFDKHKSDAGLKAFIILTRDHNRRELGFRVLDGVVPAITYRDLRYPAFIIKILSRCVTGFWKPHGNDAILAERMQQSIRQVTFILSNVLSHLDQSMCHVEQYPGSGNLFHQVLKLADDLYREDEFKYKPAIIQCVEVLLYFPADYLLDYTYSDLMNSCVFSLKENHLNKLKHAFDDYRDRFLQKLMPEDFFNAKHEITQLARAYVKLFDDIETMGYLFQLYFKKTGDHSIYITWAYYLRDSDHIVEAKAIVSQYIDRGDEKNEIYSFNSLYHLGRHCWGDSFYLGKYCPGDNSMVKQVLLLAERRISNIYNLHKMVRSYHYFSKEPELLLRLLPTIRVYLSADKITKLVYQEVELLMTILARYGNNMGDETLYDDLMHLELVDKSKQCRLFTWLGKCAWSKKFEILYLQKAEQCGVTIAEKINIAKVYKKNMDDIQNAKRMLETARELCHSNKKRKRLDKAIRRLL